MSIRLRLIGVDPAALQLRNPVSVVVRPDDRSIVPEYNCHFGIEADGLTSPIPIADIAASLEIRSLSHLDPPWGSMTLRLVPPVPGVIDVAMENAPAYGHLTIRVTDGERTLLGAGVRVMLRGPLGVPSPGLMLKGTDESGRASFYVPHGEYDATVINGATPPRSIRVSCDGSNEVTSVRGW